MYTGFKRRHYVKIIQDELPQLADRIILFLYDISANGKRLGAWVYRYEEEH